MSELDGKGSVDHRRGQEELVSSPEALGRFAKYTAPAMLSVLMSDCGGWLTWSLRQRPPIGVTN
jgi:hypothetical protein